jgi:hypothetical protein
MKVHFGLFTNQLAEKFRGLYVYGVTPNELRPINVYGVQARLDDRTNVPVYRHGWELGDLINVGDPSTPFGPW